MTYLRAHIRPNWTWSRLRVFDGVTSETGRAPAEQDAAPLKRLSATSTAPEEEDGVRGRVRLRQVRQGQLRPIRLLHAPPDGAQDHVVGKLSAVVRPIMHPLTCFMFLYGPRTSALGHRL